MKRAFLTVSCCAVLMAPFVFSQTPTYAAEPVDLEHRGDDTTFPTWHAGVSTKLCVQNLTNFPGQATVTAGNEREVIKVPSGTVCIDRYWAGIIINVVNSTEIPSDVEGEVSLRVWTE